MDEISNITRGLTTEKAADVQSQVQVSVVKKAIDIEAQQAQQLIESVPAPVSPGQPGGIINTKA
ncbi:MAG: putative motility protein [Rhodocyclales bacterium]|nr:putative motility protein [Rhodocyclales bacterium]